MNRITLVVLYLLWQPGPGQLRTCRAPEEQVEKKGFNSLPLHSFGALPALELLYGETGPRGGRTPPTGGRTVDSSQVFSLLYYLKYESLFDFGLNMPFWLSPSKVVSCFGRSVTTTNTNTPKHTPYDLPSSNVFIMKLLHSELNMPYIHMSQYNRLYMYIHTHQRFIVCF